MPFSSLEYLTVLQLKSIAKDMRIPFANNAKKAELISKLSNVLPVDFDVSRYVRIDMLNNQHNTSNVNMLSADPSLSKTQVQSNNKLFEEDTQNTYDEFESALFDVTNYEALPQSNIPEKSIPSLQQSTATHSQRRFGPANGANKQNSNMAPIPLQENTSASMSKFKQAYTSNATKKDIPNVQPDSPIIATYNINAKPISFDNTSVLLKEEQTIRVKNYLDILPSGYGFLRNESFLNSSTDTYISNGIIAKYGLRKGDLIEGIAIQQTSNLKYPALAYIEKINNRNAADIEQRITFDNLTATYSRERIQLSATSNKNYCARLIDFISPIFHGSRVFVSGQHNSGITSLLLEHAQAIDNVLYELLFVSIDAAPEEINNIKNKFNGKIFYSSLEKNNEEQIKVCDLALEYAKRQAEAGAHVVLYIDNFHHYIQCLQNVSVNSKMQSTIGYAFNKAKHYIASAKNTLEAGSITLIAGVHLSSTNKTEAMLMQDFFHKASTTIYLDNKLSEQFLFPAIDIKNSIVKKDIKQLSTNELQMYRRVHAILNSISSKQAIVQFIDMICKTKNNIDFVKKLPEWLNIWEKISNS